MTLTLTGQQDNNENKICLSILKNHRYLQCGFFWKNKKKNFTMKMGLDKILFFKLRDICILHCVTLVKDHMYT